MESGCLYVTWLTVYPDHTLQMRLNLRMSKAVETSANSAFLLTSYTGPFGT